MTVNKNSFIYVSPSLIPSKSANSVHVIMQCAAIIAEGENLTLFASRSIKDKSTMQRLILEAYGVDLSSAKIITFFNRIQKLLNLRIALLALSFLILWDGKMTVLSRNLYYSFFHAIIFCKPLIFETHQVEKGFRKILQRIVMRCQLVHTIVISRKLKEILKEVHGVAPYSTIILPDAAPDGLMPAPISKRSENLYYRLNISRKNWYAVCGYFGQLYEGRGIEIIEYMARERQDVLFVVYGGESYDVSRSKKKNRDLSNIYFGGHISHPDTQELMRCMDILLMPYQKKVSIGTKSDDTAKWMSPMKMFEYMASGLPIISSDLPVLREVLDDMRNAILVSPTDPQEWCYALDRLVDNIDLAQSIGKQAYNDYKEKYTWGVRARKILDLVN